MSNNPKPVFVTLTPDEPEESIPSTNQGRPSHVALLQGEVHVVVPDDSREPGIGETLATRLLEAGKVVFCDAEGKPLSPQAAGRTAHKLADAVSDAPPVDVPTA